MFGTKFSWTMSRQRWWTVARPCRWSMRYWLLVVFSGQISPVLYWFISHWFCKPMELYWRTKITENVYSYLTFFQYYGVPYNLGVTMTRDYTNTTVFTWKSLFMDCWKIWINVNNNVYLHFPSRHRWQFASEGADIGFGVFLKSNKGQWQKASQMTEVVHSQRYNSHLVPEEASLTCQQPGVCKCASVFGLKVVSSIHRCQLKGLTMCFQIHLIHSRAQHYN